MKVTFARVLSISISYDHMIKNMIKNMIREETQIDMSPLNVIVTLGREGVMSCDV